jgi:3-phytase/alkaline phosphatase D
MHIRSLHLLAILILLTASFSAALAGPAQNSIAGVASGDTSQTSTVLWAHTSAPGNLTLTLAADPGFTQVLSATTIAVNDPLQTVKAQVEGLTPGRPYFYRVTDAGGAVADGRFRTAVPAGTRAGLRFGVAGDWRGELSPYPAIANAPERALDLFVALGDTIYADRESPAVPGVGQARSLEQYRLKHAEVYGERFGLNVWAALRASTSLLAVIDDHEVANDFAGGAPPSSDPRFLPSDAAFINDTALFENGLQAFQEYNPLRDEFYPDGVETRLAGERRLYRYRTYGDDAALFVLDARSFRDTELPPVSDPRDPAQVQAFISASFAVTRTMLGKTQLADLQRDLAQAQAQGIIWKFVLVPEPIQNLGVLGAPDRFEGYAAERTELLKFVGEQGIENVVFVAAVIHGTVVNNLTYQQGPGQPQIASTAFEITTGSVAYDAPFGPTVIELATQAGLLTPQQRAFYDSLPRAGKDEFLRQLLDVQLAEQQQGYDPIGLQGAPLAARLVRGSYVAVHTYGWTEFVIDPHTLRLTVTTYGIDPYTRAQLEANPGAITGRAPEAVSEFTVEAVAKRVYLPLIQW